MSEKAKWMRKNYRFIAYFDIMGFKELVSRHSHTYVGKKMDTVVSTLELFKMLQGGSRSEMVRSVTFSDSIIFYTKGGTKKDAETIVKIGSLFLYLMFDDKIPLKGSLSYGEFTADSKKSLYFGRPLIDAYLLAKDMHCYGAIAHHTFEKKVKELKVAGKVKNVLNIKLVPMKNGDVKHFYLSIVDKKFRREIVKDEANINDLLEVLYDDVSGTARKYVDNTIKVYGISKVR